MLQKKRDKMVTYRITFQNDTTKSLINLCGTISVEGLMSVDEIDTILL